jgi:CHAD domain-containing protein
MLALLDLLDALQLGGALKKIRKVFKKRLDAFDDLRDTQVERRLLHPLWGDFPEARPVRKWLERREEALVVQVQREVEAAESRDLKRRLKILDADLSSPQPGYPRARQRAAAAAALMDAYSKVARLREAVRADHAPTIHKLRIAFKRYRYMSELLSPFFAEFTPKRLRRMHDFQGAAGSIQDLEVLLTHLELATAGGELDDRVTRRLRSHLARLRQDAIEAFVAQLDELATFRPAAPKRNAPL